MAEALPSSGREALRACTGTDYARLSSLWEEETGRLFYDNPLEFDKECRFTLTLPPVVASYVKQLQTGGHKAVLAVVETILKERGAL